MEISQKLSYQVTLYFVFFGRISPSYARICNKKYRFSKKVIEIWANFDPDLLNCKGLFGLLRYGKSNFEIPKMAMGENCRFRGPFLTLLTRTFGAILLVK